MGEYFTKKQIKEIKNSSLNFPLVFSDSKGRAVTILEIIYLKGLKNEIPSEIVLKIHDIKSETIIKYKQHDNRRK